jgi:hypothetical protein
MNNLLDDVVDALQIARSQRRPSSIRANRTGRIGVHR